MLATQENAKVYAKHSGPVARLLRQVFLYLFVVLLTQALAATAPVFTTPAFAQSETDEAEEGADEEPEKKEVGKHIFIKMEPLISPLLDDRSIKGKITLRLKLHLITPKVEEKVRHRVPQLNDAYLNYMYRYGSSAASTGVMQLESVLRTLQRLTDKILGKDVVKVLIEEISRTRS
jgi:flagellar basal body-associated protein FliL